MRINPAFLLTALLVAAAGCNSGDSGSVKSNGAPPLTQLKSEDTVVGKGAPVARGDDVWVLYTGTLTNGHVFDTNKKEGGVPFHVSVGGGQVIKGWDQGLLGMKKGGTRKLLIPSDLAYGSQGTKGIPPNTDLVFVVELLDVLKKEDATSIVVDDIKKGAGQEAKVGSTVTIDYETKANGQPFEDPQKNVKFKIGEQQTEINGFDMAINGMQVGGVREIRVPPMLTRMLAANEKLGMNVAVYTVTLKAVN